MRAFQKFVATLKGRSTAVGAVGAAAMLTAAVLVVQSSPRSELDVQLSDGGVWLASTVVGGVSLLDGGSGTIAASLGVADPGDEFTVEQFGSDAVIVNQTDGTVARLDGSSWEIPTGRVQFGVPGQPISVVTGNDGGWLMTPGQATTVELEELALRTPVPVAAPFADGIITDDGALLYASTDPDVPVQRFEALGGASSNVADLDGPTALIDLGSMVGAVDLDDRTVWLDGVGTVCEQLEFPEGATLSAGGGEGLLMVISDQGGAFVWNPEQSGCPDASNFISLSPGDYGKPALTDGWAVIPERATSSVLVIDLEDLSISDRQPLEGVELGAEVSLIAEDGSIWYNDPASSHAGLVRRDGSVVPISKYEEGATGFTSAPVDDAPDGADDMSLAGAQQDQEELEDLAPEAEEVAGPELTTTTVTGAGEEPAATTTTTEAGSTTGSSDTSETTTETTDPETTDPDTSETSAGPVVTTDPDSTTSTTDPDSTTSTTDPIEEELAITISLTAQSVTVGDTINFTAVTQHGSFNRYDISFSPSGPETLPIDAFGSFRVLFPEAGSFVATMGACNADNECAEARTVITIVEDEEAIPLVAAINGPATVVVGEIASFSDISQGDPDSWNWSTDGGTPATATSQNVDISWPTAAPRTVTLRVTRGNSTKTETFLINVVNAPVAAPFGVICSPTAPSTGEDVTCSLDGTASDFSDISFATTADGAAGFSRSVPTTGRLSMQSTQERTVTVTLSATDDGTGESVSDTASVTFTDPACPLALPVVSVSGPTTREIGQTGTYTATSSADCGAVSQLWTANGSPSIANSEALSTSISWATAGTYTVRFAATDGGGSGQDSMTVTVTDPAPVDEAPSIAISGSSNLDTDETGSFSVSNAGGSISSYSWTSNGGGGSGSGANFSASWNAPGTYTVTVTVTGPGGSDVDDYEVTVTDPPPPASPFGMTCDRAIQTLGSGQMINCDLTTGDPANFSNPQWTVGPASANQWEMSPWSMDAQGTVAGTTVTVTLSATDLATGLTVSNSSSIMVVAAVTTTVSIPGSTISIPDSTTTTTEPTTTTTAPITTTTTTQPAPPVMSVSCVMINSIRARCTAGNAGEYSGLSWSVSGDGYLEWGGGGSIDVGTTVAGATVFVTVTGTHSSGQVGSASGSITIANAT